MTADQPAPRHLIESSALKWLAGLAVAAVILSRLSASDADPDLWGYLAFGREFWTNGIFPIRDPFAYTPTLDAWIYHEWLTGVLFHPLYVYGGPAALQTAKYLIGAVTALLAYATARRRFAPWWAAVGALLLVSPVFGLGYSPVRAQVFTHLGLLLTIYLLESFRVTGSTRYLIWLPGVFVSWANLHGGFLAGLGLLGLYVLALTGEKGRWRPAGLAWLAAAAATLANPYGWDYWVYLLRAVTMPRPEIDEWHSWLAALGNGEYLANNLFFSLAVLVAVPSALHFFRRDYPAFLGLAVTAYLGFRHGRHQALFLLTLGAYAPRAWAAAWDSLKASSPRIAARWAAWGRRLAGFVFVCLVLLSGWRLAGQTPLDLRIPSKAEGQGSEVIHYPAGAVDYIRGRGLAGRILGEFHWGEYLIWTLYPRCRVGMDGRYETVYPEALCREYFDFIQARPGWEEFLERYPPDLILVDANRAIRYYLLMSRDWREVYSDSGCALFSRR